MAKVTVKNVEKNTPVLNEGRLYKRICDKGVEGLAEVGDIYIACFGASKLISLRTGRWAWSSDASQFAELSADVVVELRQSDA